MCLYGGGLETMCEACMARMSSASLTFPSTRTMPLEQSALAQATPEGTRQVEPALGMRHTGTRSARTRETRAGRSFSGLYRCLGGCWLRTLDFLECIEHVGAVQLSHQLTHSHHHLRAVREGLLQRPAEREREQERVHASSLGRRLC